MREHRNRLVLRHCWKCGRDRPQDWFATEDGDCWKCRALAPAPAEVAAAKRRRLKTCRRGGKV